MPTRRLSTLIACACLGSATGAAGQASPRVDLQSFDRYVAHAVADWHAPGLAIAVVHDDSLVFAKGYGLIEAGKPAPVNEHTRFAIGSTTKAMTSAALAMLVDEGKLKWDDPVVTYIPELRLYDAYATHELTIRDLLTHRSGLAGTDLLWTFNSYTMPEIIRRLRYVKPATSFRSTWEYQNVMYSLGGVIVARVSGMPWETFIRTRIFAPLGMTESEPLVSAIMGKPNVAVPHRVVGDSARVVPVRSTDAIAPAGSVWSSVWDMSKWMRFILDSGRVSGSQTRLIAPATFVELVTPQIRAPLNEYPALELARPHVWNYGLGWFIQEYHGQTIWMHTGSIDGMCAIIGLMPDTRTGVYVLENGDHIELRHALMYQALDLYAGNPPRDWSTDVRTLFANLRRSGGAGGSRARATGAPPSLPLDRYAGTYVDSTYGTVEVTFTGGSLRARFANHELGVLEPLQYDSFRARAEPDGQVTPMAFQPDGSGGVTSVRVLGETFARVAEPGRPTR